MDQLVKCLLHKDGDVSSIFSTHVGKVNMIVVVFFCSPSDRKVEP